ncbi:hypothetical protein ACI7RC_16690 [Brevibacillus sp. B_LB10_24]|jgi:hypothetical protein|uniref:hypothetical protein n=1 Tax=Brevibacillus TaxID=55080 RepID=UPI0003066052|nr:hypothetical protein [Brevibacillus massiliensis]
MSFCCGAGMLGSFGTVRHYKTLVHNVPVMYCPVCNRLEVLPAIEGEFEILVEYAQGDNAPEVDFRDFVSIDNMPHLFDNCTMTDEGNYAEVLKQQIDIALDLMGVAKDLDDSDWRDQLKARLTKLSQRLRQYNKRKEISQRSA